MDGEIILAVAMFVVTFQSLNGQPFAQRLALSGIGCYVGVAVIVGVVSSIVHQLTEVPLLLITAGLLLAGVGWWVFNWWQRRRTATGINHH